MHTRIAKLHCNSHCWNILKSAQTCPWFQMGGRFHMPGGFIVIYLAIPHGCQRRGTHLGKVNMFWSSFIRLYWHTIRWDLKMSSVFWDACVRVGCVFQKANDTSSICFFLNTWAPGVGHIGGLPQGGFFGLYQEMDRITSTGVTPCSKTCSPMPVTRRGSQLRQSPTTCV